jgi:hypothetical protein
LPVKLVIGGDYYFSDRFGVQLSYGPAYQFASAGVHRGVNNEWLVMLYGRLFSRLSGPGH